MVQKLILVWFSFWDNGDGYEKRSFTLCICLPLQRLVHHGYHWLCLQRRSFPPSRLVVKTCVKRLQAHCNFTNNRCYSCRALPYIR
ncbi:hypothetical protein G7K_3249-t1 [Saitoella complicata NRRL Y-17804]|uniref:Uncharacterized protein n=1 Tax=Saitoella complicata (strain BCRC 22490 / CBS 7301 / JCM 7358 / NBRC 10748 / NRRL Y-17804) TaxID=698492 RepID=A0A0E9NHD8_SAICN|nr:hypothetical protein G7K_3249-t1 [Saitoella complicata NRRL Y-17804]